MTDEEFWRLIDESRRDFDPDLRDGNMDRQVQRLHTLLSELPTDALQDYHRVFQRFFRLAYRWDLWGAAYIIEGGCSDDGFTDFRHWLISMGRSVFEAALADPESLGTAARTPGVEACAFEDFGYVPYQVLEERGVDPSDSEALPDPPDPMGQRWDEDALPRLFPSLWAQFGEEEDA